MTKLELRKKFNTWLGNEFDKQNKNSPGETHRWLLCYDGLEGEQNYGFDCACCLTDEEYIDDKGVNKCGCHCHERISQIVDFFWEYMRDKE